MSKERWGGTNKQTSDMHRHANKGGGGGCHNFEGKNELIYM